MKPISYTSRFETVGDLYYRHSGRLRPGKDSPPGSGRDSSSPENKAVFDDWAATLCFGQALDRIAELEAVIAKLRADIEAENDEVF